MPRAHREWEGERARSGRHPPWPDPESDPDNCLTKRAVWGYHRTMLARRRACATLVHMKSDLLKDHFLNPRGMGAAADATHHAIAKSEVCNDIVKMTARIRGGVIEEVRTQVYGCGYAIAGASLFNERASGMDAADAAGMDTDELVL
jgi:hypothetical protein